MRTGIRNAFVGILAATICSAAMANINLSFDDPDLSAWGTDRYAPAVFETTTFDGDNRLHLGLREADQQANRTGGQSGAFYNYQGKKLFAGDAGWKSVSVDMYLDSAWLAGTRAGMWLTASNGNLSYPIIEFVVAGDTTEYGSANFTGIRRWQSGYGWTEGLAMSADDAWHNLRIDLTPTEIRYYFDGTLFGTADPLHADSFDNVILQGHNQGMAGEYDIYYDNFQATAIPAPGAALLGLLGLSIARRIKRRMA